MTALRLRRFVPRFSLRTLVVFLLLVTSALGLWSRYHPRVPAVSERRAVLERPTSASFASYFRSAQNVLIAFPWPRAHETKFRFVTVKDPEGIEALAAPLQRLGPVEEITSGEVAILVFIKDDEYLAVGAYVDGVMVFHERYKWTYAMPEALRREIARHRETVLVRNAWRRPAFWLTVALAGVFVWSVIRDRKALRAAPIP